MRLKEKVAIVTGGARGIGEAIAGYMAREGARIALVDLDGSVAEATAETLGVDAIVLEADASEESQMKEATQKVIDHFGGLDILVNNGYIHKRKPAAIRRNGPAGHLS